MAPDPEKSQLLQQLRIDRDQRDGDEPSSRRSWLIAAAALGLLLTGGGLWYRFAGPKAAVVHTVVARSMTGSNATASVLDATGYVTARREATVSAQITGTLTEVLIEEGDRVQAGQVLGRLDDTAQRAALAQAQAQVRAARALVDQFQAQLAQARRDLARNADLVGRKLVSQQAVETSRTQVDSLAAQLESQEKEVELAQAGVRGAEVQLGYCTVRAPFSGIIIAKAAQAGEIISPISAGGGFTRTGVGTIVDMDSLEVEVDVNEAYINRVQPGQPVHSVLNAYPDWIIPSHVIAIIPTADRSKATVKVRIGIDVKDNRIVPDMGVRVSFLEDQKAAQEPEQAPRGVLVPNSSLHKDGDADVVFVAQDRRAERRSVTLGGAFADSRQVVSGLSPGEAVIVDAPATLRGGDAVIVTP